MPSKRSASSSPEPTSEKSSKLSFTQAPTSSMPSSSPKKPIIIQALTPPSMPSSTSDPTPVIGHITDATSSTSFYMRTLPPPSISLHSPEGEELFDEARAAKTAVGSLNLLAHFQTQKELAFCGLTTLTSTLNALNIDPLLVWKGNWRWFDESMLVDEEMMQRVIVEGINFEEFIHAVPTDKVTLEAFYASESSLSDFRCHLSRVTSTTTSVILASYSRRALNQTGDGHYSPIAAYHAKSDLVLILDVARYKYPPHWVPCTDLWEAMAVTDETTGKSRGFMVISKPSMCL